MTAPLPVSRVDQWTRELLIAVQRTHLQGIVHYDIQSSNVLLDQHDRLALADFGSARDLTPSLRHQDVQDTLQVIRWLSRCVAGLRLARRG